MVLHLQKRWRLKFRRDPDAGRVLFIGPLVLSLDVVRGKVSQHAWRSSRLREWLALRLLGLATWAAAWKAARKTADKPLTREQIDAVMTEHYPLDSLLRENVDAFEACVRDIERLHGIGA